MTETQTYDKTPTQKVDAENPPIDDNPPEVGVSEPVPPDDDLKIDWLALAKMSQESFHNRRSYEWKLAFGFWAAIGAFTAAFFKYFETAQKLPWCISVIIVIVIVVLYGVLFYVGWQYFLKPLQIAHSGDKRWWKYYLDKAQGSPERLERPTKMQQRKMLANSKRWLTGQLVFTGVFLVMSLSLIIVSLFAPNKGAPKSDATKPVVSKPGENGTQK